MKDLKHTDERFTTYSCGSYSLKNYGSEDLVRLYRDYDVFYAHLAATARLGYLEDMITLRPVEDWEEAFGSCLWWSTDRIEQEPEYVGSPIGTDWNEDMKYFIEIPNVIKKEESNDTKIQGAGRQKFI